MCRSMSAASARARRCSRSARRSRPHPPLQRSERTYTSDPSSLRSESLTEALFHLLEIQPRSLGTASFPAAVASSLFRLATPLFVCPS